jgi:hypothetical protein
MLISAMMMVTTFDAPARSAVTNNAEIPISSHIPRNIIIDVYGPPRRKIGRDVGRKSYRSRTPAAGPNSPNIGVAESSNRPAVQELDLVGSGAFCFVRFAETVAAICHSKGSVRKCRHLEVVSSAVVLWC